MNNKIATNSVHFGMRYIELMDEDIMNVEFMWSGDLINPEMIAHYLNNPHLNDGNTAKSICRIISSAIEQRNVGKS